MYSSLAHLCSLYIPLCLSLSLDLSIYCLPHSLTHSLTYIQALDSSLTSTNSVPVWDGARPNSLPSTPATPGMPLTPHTPLRTRPATGRPVSASSWRSYASYYSDLSNSTVGPPSAFPPAPPPITQDRFVGTPAKEVLGVLTAIHIQELGANAIDAYE